MALISIPYTFTVGATIVASQHNANFQAIYNDYNGNITDANISASANIDSSKISQITTPSKVSGAALASLDSIPSGAGTIPSKNGGTGGDLSSSTQGSVPYFSGTGVMTSLGTGTSGQVLKTQGASANPIWANAIGAICDYNTATTSYTARQATEIKIAFGQYSFSSNGSQAITNLPFTSTSSYQVTLGDGYAIATSENIRIIKDSASQFTLYNDIARACTVHWHAIGT